MAKDKEWVQKVIRFLAGWGVGEVLSYLWSLFTWKTVLSILAALAVGVGTLFTRLPWPLAVVVGLAGFAFTLFLINEGIAFIKWWNTVKTSDPPRVQRPSIHSKAAQPTEPQLVERIFVTHTPDDITAFYEAHTHIQADKLLETFKGKWMRVSDEVGEVDVIDQDLLCVRFASRWLRGLGPDLFLSMVFNKAKWGEQLGPLRRGDKIAVVGKIHSADNTSLILMDCELEE